MIHTLNLKLHKNPYIYWAKSKKEKTEADTFWKRLKSAQPLGKQAGQIFTIYLAIVLIGGLLLCTPGIVHSTGTINNGGITSKVKWNWHFLLGLFDASSAFSDTGLSIANASQDFSIWGQIIIALLIQLGGFGVLTFKIMLWVLLGRKFKIKDLILVQSERGGSDFGSVVKLIKRSFVFLIFVEIIAAVVLMFAFYFYSPGSMGGQDFYNPYHNFGRSLWSGIFHSISAVNNAGFDIIGKQSLQPYNQIYLIQIIFLLEFVIGGIGFPTFYDLSKKKFGFDSSQKLTLFTKLNLITYGLLSVVGVGLVAAVEYGSGHNSQILSTSHGGFNGFMNIFFNTMSTRNAGFSTVNTVHFLPGSKIIQSIMMFIGSAPSSTAGGIRTTTLAVLLIGSWATIRRRQRYNVWKRSIPAETVQKSGIVLFSSIIIVGIVTLVIVSTNSTWSPIDIFYTVCSAFGTVGLSNLSAYQMYHIGSINLILLIATMFIGQLGVSGTLLAWTGSNPHREFTFAEEAIKIG